MTVVDHPSPEGAECPFGVYGFGFAGEQTGGRPSFRGRQHLPLRFRSAA